MFLPPPPISVPPVVDFAANTEEPEPYIKSFCLNCARVPTLGHISKVRITQESETILALIFREQTRKLQWEGKASCHLHFDFLILIQEVQCPWKPIWHVLVLGWKKSDFGSFLALSWAAHNRHRRTDVGNPYYWAVFDDPHLFVYCLSYSGPYNNFPQKNRIILLVLLYQGTFLIIHCYLGIGILCCLVLVCKAHFSCVKLFLFCSVLPILGINLINVIMP